jgi:hypothetical protein
VSPRATKPPRLRRRQDLGPAQPRAHQGDALYLGASDVELRRQRCRRGRPHRTTRPIEQQSGPSCERHVGGGVRHVTKYPLFVTGPGGKPYSPGGSGVSTDPTRAGHAEKVGGNRSVQANSPLFLVKCSGNASPERLGPVASRLLHRGVGASVASVLGLRGSSTPPRRETADAVVDARRAPASSPSAHSR